MKREWIAATAVVLLTFGMQAAHAQPAAKPDAEAAKKAEAQKKEADALARAQERAVESYKRTLKDGGGMTRKPETQQNGEPKKDAAKEGAAKP